MGVTWEWVSPGNGNDLKAEGMSKTRRAHRVAFQRKRGKVHKHQLLKTPVYTPNRMHVPRTHAPRMHRTLRGLTQSSDVHF
jgi:hypothetical protein